MRRLAVLILLLALGCARMLGGSGGLGGSASWSFVVVVHNTASVPMTVSISTDLDGYAAVNTFTTIPANGSATWLCGQDATPAHVFLHDPQTWTVPGIGHYDQVYRWPTEYAPDSKWLDVSYP